MEGDCWWGEWVGDDVHFIIEDVMALMGVLKCFYIIVFRRSTYPGRVTGI